MLYCDDVFVNVSVYTLIVENGVDVSDGFTNDAGNTVLVFCVLSVELDHRVVDLVVRTGQPFDFVLQDLGHVVTPVDLVHHVVPHTIQTYVGTVFCDQPKVLHTAVEIFQDRLRKRVHDVDDIALGGHIVEYGNHS